MPPSWSISLFLAVAPFEICRATNPPTIADLEHWQLLRLCHEHYGSLRHAKVIRNVFDRQCLRLVCRHVASPLARAVLRVSDAGPVVACYTSVSGELHAWTYRVIMPITASVLRLARLCYGARALLRPAPLCSLCSKLDVCAIRVSSSHRARVQPPNSSARSLAQRLSFAVSKSHNER